MLLERDSETVFLVRSERTRSVQVEKGLEDGRLAKHTSGGDSDNFFMVACSFVLKVDCVKVLLFVFRCTFFDSLTNQWMDGIDGRFNKSSNLHKLTRQNKIAFKLVVCAKLIEATYSKK